MEQIQETITSVLKKQPSKRPTSVRSKKGESNKFDHTVKAKPDFKYINRERILKKMDKFYGPLHNQAPFPQFEHDFKEASLECERLHID